MNIDHNKAKAKIKRKIAELAQVLGNDAGNLGDDDVIPQMDLLDSASLMVLIVWYEEEFQLSTEQEEPTIDNFGTVNLMVSYLQRNG